MKIQPSKELESIQKRLNKPIEWIEANIIRVLIEYGVIELSEAYYGQTIGSCLALVPIYDPKKALKKCLGLLPSKKPSRKFLYEFESLVLIGDGDCPHCGGDLETVMTGSSKLFEAETRETPAVYEHQRGDLCLVCGNIFNLKYE